MSNCVETADRIIDKTVWMIAGAVLGLAILLFIGWLTYKPQKHISNFYCDKANQTAIYVFGDGSISTYYDPKRCGGQDD